MSFNYGPIGVRIEEFRELEPTVDDESKVQNTASCEGSLSGDVNVEIDTAAYQTQNQSSHPLDVVDSSLSADQLDLSVQTLPDLGGEREAVVVSGQQCISLSLLLSVFINLSQEALVVFRSSERSRQIRRRLEVCRRRSGSHSSLDGIRSGSEELGSCLSRNGNESKVLEILPGLGCSSEECHLSVIQNDDLVKVPVEILACLVKGGHAGLVADIRDSSQSFGKVECGRRVETTGRVVKALDRRAGSENFSNRHSVFFSVSIVDFSKDGCKTNRFLSPPETPGKKAPPTGVSRA